mgnify:CR=1 FL=1
MHISWISCENTKSQKYKCFWRRYFTSFNLFTKIAMVLTNQNEPCLFICCPITTNWLVRKFRIRYQIWWGALLIVDRKTETYPGSLHDSEWITIINFFIIMHIEMFLTAIWNFTFFTQLVSFFQTQKAERFCIFNLTKAVFSHAYFYSFYYLCSLTLGYISKYRTYKHRYSLSLRKHKFKVGRYVRNGCIICLALSCLPYAFTKIKSW